MEKVLEVLKIVLKAFTKFLRYDFVSQISYFFLAVLIGLLTTKLWGILAVGWGVLLLIARINEQSKS